MARQIELTCEKCGTKITVESDCIIPIKCPKCNKRPYKKRKKK
jgi:hypothetical protein